MKWQEKVLRYLAENYNEHHEPLIPSLSFADNKKLRKQLMHLKFFGGKEELAKLMAKINSRRKAENYLPLEPETFEAIIGKAPPVRKSLLPSTLKMIDALPEYRKRILRSYGKVKK